jgi:hypothetical protein
VTDELEHLRNILVHVHEKPPERTLKSVLRKLVDRFKPKQKTVVVARIEKPRAERDAA